MLTLNKIYKNEFKDDFVKKFLDPNYKDAKYFFGTNYTARQLFDLLTNYVNIDGFINTSDNDLQEFMQKPVLHENDLMNLSSNTLILSCVMGVAVVEVDNFLSQFHFRHLDCFAFSKHIGGGDYNIDFFVNYFNGYRFGDCTYDIVKNIAKYQNIYNKLNDNLSRHIFSNLINFRISGDINYMRGFKVANERQYFEDFLALPTNPTFVDAGGYTGDTALQFISRYSKFNKIYLFEPDSQNIVLAKQNLKNYPNIMFYQKGLSNTNGNMRFSMHGLGSSVDESGKAIIEIVKLDNIIKEKVDFIKMDIEGSEGVAIDGAKETIKKYRPTLAICVYHKKDDFWKISEQILAIRSDYKLYFRHYTQGIDESVMYFVGK